MIRNLISRLVSSRIVQRLAHMGRELAFYWVTVEKGNIVFAMLLGIPVMMLVGIIYVAYANHAHIVADQQRFTDLGCLARNVYHEARGESFVGQRAVAEVTLNRVASKLFPDTVCDVVYEMRWDPKRKRNVGAFSWTELDSVERPNGSAWQLAVDAAQSVYDREHAPVVHGALFYHANRISPRWAKTKNPVAKIGSHTFYE